MVDAVVTAPNVKASAAAVTDWGTLGETATQGQAVRIDAAAGDSLKLADADASAASAAAIAILLTAGANGQPAKYVIKDPAFQPGFPVTVGEIYVLSGTPGGICPEADLAPGDYVTVIGVGKTSSTIDLDIKRSGVQVPV